MKSFYFYTCFVLAFLLMHCEEPIQPTASTNPYKSASGVTTISTDNQTVENLVVLGRVWGFLKYYHPIVTCGGYNWDHELFEVMPKVIASKTTDERNTVLSEWISSLGTFSLEDSVPVIDSADVKLWPDYSWMNEASLGKGLTDKLNKIRTAKRSRPSTYVQYTSVLSPVIRDESLYDSLQFPDAGYRILCLYRYWNIIEYFFPDKHLIGRPWDEVLKEYVPKFTNCQSELDYEICVIRMAAEIHDSHATVYGDIDAFQDYRGRYNAMVTLSMVEGKAIVTGYLNSLAETSSGLAIGDIIVSVDGITIDSMYSDRKQNIRASNEAVVRRNFCTAILTSKDSIVGVGLDRDGAYKLVDVPCYLTTDSLRSLTYYGIDTGLYMAAPDIACIFPGLVNVQPLAKFLNQSRDAKGIIIDFRCYPKDDIINTISNFLLPAPTPVAKYTHTNFTTPGLFTYTDDEIKGEHNSDYYKGKVVILVNENTQSSAEWHTMAFQKAPRAIVLGSTTAGADGNVSEINLPGGIKTMFSGIGVYYPDGRETQRVGIVPDIEVHPTIKGLREGRDEVMEAAIAYINR